jgi:hypothetical protein
MEQLTMVGMPLEPAPLTNDGLGASKSAVKRYAMVLCSRVPGRDRWYVEALEDRPRLAAAVEAVLKSEEGIENVHVNPLTGRVLVHYSSDLISEAIEELIGRALAFGPMSREEFNALRPKGSDPWFPKHFVAAEIGCTLLKMTFLGACCPLALTAAGLLFFLHRRG